MLFLKAQESLRIVKDPELDINILDLGLVNSVYFDSLNKEILVNMTLTSQFCPMGESIVQSVEFQLQLAFPDFKSKAETTFDRPWNSDRISEEGLRYLNIRK